MPASVMLEPSIGPPEDLVAVVGLANPFPRLAKMFLSPVAPVVALSVDSGKCRRAMGALKRVRRRGTCRRRRS